tara:strand:+ start:150 stop:599 length:450 start_codon:yes stop_codon:yes gene_type:complete
MEPTHTVAKAMCGRVTFRDNGICSEVLGNPRGEGPCVVGRVSRGVVSARTRANQRANREAEGDTEGLRARGRGEGHTRSHHGGQVGGTERPGGTNRERAVGGREGNEEGRGEGGPGFLPVMQMAVISQPYFDAWVEDDKAVIKVCAVAP